MSQAAAFTVFRLILALVIFVESSLTVLNALQSTIESQLNHVLPWFGGVEAAAALLLLVPATVKIAGWVLLVMFAADLIVHGPAHHMSLIVYAAGVVLIMSRPTFDQ